MDGIRIFGVVKEIGVDDQGLWEFQKDFFPYPIYRDQSYTFYTALGDRKLAFNLLFNPLGFLPMILDAWNRVTKKGIRGNLRGEGIVQGGIVLFDKSGKPLAMYQEETGVDLPVSDLVRAFEVIRRQHGT